MKALLVLRHEAPNVLERVVGFSFFNGIQQVYKVMSFITVIYRNS